MAVSLADLKAKAKAELPGAVRKALKFPRTLFEIADECETSPKAVKAIIAEMMRGGVLVVQRNDGRFLLDKELEPGAAGKFSLSPDRNGWIRFGFCGDNHMGSKHARQDVLDSVYDVFAGEEISTVYNTGNWIDGEARFNKYELVVHGMQRQCEHFAEYYPQRKGIITNFIAGDDHEGWYQQRESISIGKFAERIAIDSGRSDLVYMGYMEADVRLGKWPNQVIRVTHPGGGSAYAVSYTSQKYIESLQGGEKPCIVLAGHYHKYNHSIIRNVHIVQTLCTQDQTIFMRKKRLEAVLGGGIIEAQLDPADGHILQLSVRVIGPFYDRKFYEKRWDIGGAA